MHSDKPIFRPLTWGWAGGFALLAIAGFHAAYTPAQSGLLAFGIVGYVIGLVQLARLRTTRQCFYVGLLVGFACVAPQLAFFWKLFGSGAVALWLILALWIASFIVLTHLALARLGAKWAAVLVPFFWTGLEYFRSELYYLRFSWLNVGYAFADSATVTWLTLGMFTAGFITAALAGSCLTISRISFRMTLIQLGVVLALIVIPLALLFPAHRQLIRRHLDPDLIVAGVQMEHPDEDRILPALDRAISLQRKPDIMAQVRGRDASTINIVVLSEYTLDGEPTAALKAWCRTNQKFLVVGGKSTAPGSNYYNTAFVVGTNGQVVFKQVKSVPIQFFTDGLPAPEQKLWQSPWGKIGICICYDLSYTRVTDELVRQGAQMLIVPTMDEAHWGTHQHELHARLAPVRASEYGVPIFRLASSGISQGVNRLGRVLSTAPFPGEEATMIFGAALPKNGGTRPLDRWLAPICVGVTGCFLGWLILGRMRGKRFNVQLQPLPQGREQQSNLLHGIGNAARWGVRKVLRFYYPRIEIDGHKHVPHNGAVLFVANHPNSLMDPALVGFVAQRSVHFFAKAPLFDVPVFGALMRALGMVPAYRGQDDKTSVRKNLETLDVGATYLRAGAAVGIFPEGKTHDREGLEQVRTGAARIAASAAQSGAPFTIVALGLNYERKDRFRSSIWVRVAEPIDALSFFRAHAGEEKQAMRALTEQLDSRLKQLVIHLNEPRWQPMLDELDALLPASAEATADPIAKLRQRKIIADAINHFLASDRPRAEQITNAIEAHRCELASHGLRMDSASVQLSGPALGWKLAKETLWLLPGLLPFIAGTLHHLVPFLLTRGIVQLVKYPGRVTIAQNRLMIGIPIYAIWYAAFWWFLNHHHGPAFAWLWTALMPFAGIEALHYAWRMRFTRRAWWSEIKMIFDRDKLVKLRAEQMQLQQLMAQLRGEYLARQK